MAGDRRSSTRKLDAGPSPQTLVEGPGPEELRQALAVLEAVVSDRAILAQLPEEERTRLLVAAGRTVHPDLQQKRRLVRSLRSAERRRAEARDRAVLAQTGIRSARQAEVFVAPPKALEAGEPLAGARGRHAEEVLRLQGRVPPRPLLLRRDVPALRRAQLREALPDGGPPRARSRSSPARG